MPSSSAPTPTDPVPDSAAAVRAAHDGAPRPSHMERELGLPQAAALNIANMVGIGPFITIPTFLAAMNGPQAMIAWGIAAVLVTADGLVWSELGAAFPGSGGSYHFLRELFERYRWGRLMPFLFIWQFLISGALEMASGYIGAVMYLKYLWPSLDELPLPGGASCLAAAAALTISLCLLQPIRRLGLLSMILCAGTLLTVVVVIVAGWLNFDSSLLRLPEHAFRLDGQFVHGLGAAMMIAIYDYLGYYNVCHLGEEVHNPARTIPRAVMISIAVVATIYFSMNLAIIGVIPWQEASKSENIAALFMERLYGRSAANALTLLILWTVVACMFAITLGYSRIPYAAARRGDFFPVFARVLPVSRAPYVSLLALGLLTAAFCFIDLATVISAAVAVRIVVQFSGQIVGLILARRALPRHRFPFRMWLYPLPCLVALAGWLFVFLSAEIKVILGSLAVLASGAVGFAVFQFWNRNTRPVAAASQSPGTAAAAPNSSTPLSNSNTDGTIARDGDRDFGSEGDR